MSAVLTYDTLVANLESYLDRDDAKTIARIPTFILNAQTRVCRELRILGFIKPVTATFTTGEAIVPKPALWRETVSWNIGTGTGNNTRKILLPRTYEYIRSLWPDATQTGQPRYYADYDYNHWIVGPTPSAAFPFEVLYYRLMEPIDATTQTNFLTDYAPDMLLYACLLETAPYLKDDERIQTWQSRYDRCLQAEMLDDIRDLIDRSQQSSEKGS